MSAHLKTALIEAAKLIDCYQHVQDFQINEHLFEMLKKEPVKPTKFGDKYRKIARGNQ